MFNKILSWNPPQSKCAALQIDIRYYLFFIFNIYSRSDSSNLRRTNLPQIQLEAVSLVVMRYLKLRRSLQGILKTQAHLKT